MDELEVVEINEKPEIDPVFVNKSLLDEKAEKLRDKITLPRKPGSSVTFRDMLEWLALVPEEALETIMVYLYRLQPLSNRQMVDPQAVNNIDVYSGDTLRHLTEDLVTEVHGGGKYRFIVADLNKKGKEKGEGFRADLYIPMVQCPPKMDLRTVLWDDPANKGFRNWARARNLINEQNMPVEVSNGGTIPQSQESMVAAMKLAMDFAEKMSAKDQAEIKRRMGVEDGLGKSIGDILLEKMKQDDPNKQVQTLSALLGAMKGMMPEVKASDNTIVASMMTMVTTMITTLVDSSNKQAAMMMQFMEMTNNNRNGKEDRDEFAKMRDILEIAKEVKGGGKERSTAEVIVEGATTLLAPALQLVNNIVTMNIMKQHGAMPGMSGPGPSGPGQQGTASPLSASGATPQPAPAPSAPAGLPAPGEATAIIANYAPLIVKHLGHDGWEFGVMVSDMFGDDVAAGIARYGTENLMTAAKGVTEFWKAVEGTYGEAHLRKWLDSLCHYREEAKKADEEDDAALEGESR